MDFKISAKQITRFIYTAFLMQLAVYFIVGLICKYRFSFSMIQFSYGLSYAGLGLLVIAGIVFTVAKPKTWRPGTNPKPDQKTEPDPDEEPEEDQGTFDYDYFSPIKSIFNFSSMIRGLNTCNDAGADKKFPRLTQKQLYYYSGLFFLVGLITILSSELIYRGLL